MDGLLEGLLTRLEAAGPRFEEYRILVRNAALISAAADVRGLWRPSATSPEQSRLTMELCTIYGVPTLLEAESRHAADLQVLRDLLTGTAWFLGEQLVGQMRMILADVESLRTAPATDAPAPASLNPIDRFARALSAWLVYTSELPFPALQEDLPLWRSHEMGPPPGPDPPPIPGGVPAPSNDSAEWNERDRGVGAWRAFGLSNLQAHYAHWLYREERPEALKALLLDPTVGGFPPLVLVRHLRTPAQIYRMLREAPDLRRTMLEGLLGDISRHLTQSVVEAESAFKGGKDADWSTLGPLLQSARAIWFSPEGEPGLWALAENQIETIEGWTLQDKIELGILLVGLALTVASLGTGSAAFFAAAAGVDAIATGMELGSLLADRATSEQINRFAEIDAALAIADSVQSIDQQILIAAMFALLAPVVGAAVPAAVRRIRRLARPIPEHLMAAISRRLQASAPAWMRELAEASTRSPSGARPSVRPAPSGSPASVPPTGTRHSPIVRPAQAVAAREEAIIRGTVNTEAASAPSLDTDAVKVARDSSAGGSTAVPPMPDPPEGVPAVEDSALWSSSAIRVPQPGSRAPSSAKPRFDSDRGSASESGSISSAPATRVESTTELPAEHAPPSSTGGIVAARPQVDFPMARAALNDALSRAPVRADSLGAIGIAARREQFRAELTRALHAQPDHPLSFLINESGALRPSTARGVDQVAWLSDPRIVEAGHVISAKSLHGVNVGTDRFAVMSAHHNRLISATIEHPRKGGSIDIPTAIEIGGIPVHAETAVDWVANGWLTIEHLASAHPVAYP